MQNAIANYTIKNGPLSEGNWEFGDMKKDLVTLPKHRQITKVSLNFTLSSQTFFFSFNDTRITSVMDHVAWCIIEVYCPLSIIIFPNSTQNSQGSSMMIFNLFYRGYSNIPRPLSLINFMIIFPLEQRHSIYH